MIVPSMTDQEIHKEVFEDIRNLQSKLEECQFSLKPAFVFIFPVADFW